MKPQHLTTLFISLALSLGLFLALTPDRVHAAGPITVTTATDSDTADSDCSLREAIVAANTDTAYNGCSAGSGADGITFAGNYTITLTSALPVITSSVTITGTGTANTIIQASTCNPFAGDCITATHRVFTVMTTTVTLKGMTVRHGACTTGGNCALEPELGGNIYASGTTLTLDGVNVQSGYAKDQGGGIYSSNGNLTLQNNSLIGGEGAGNRTATSDGGGIYFVDGGNLLIDNSRIAYNYAFGYSGGVHFEGSLTATIQNGTQIDHNTAEPSNGDYAGGMYAHKGASDCLLTIADSTLAQNRGGDQAGGLWTGCTTTISGSTIFSNTTIAGPGGGINIMSNTVVTVTNSIIYSNTVTGVTKDGGGIYNRGTLTVLNSTVAGNSATGNGGGIYNTGTLTLHHSRVTTNTAPNGGGIHLQAGSGTIEASTIAHNYNNGDAGGIFNNGTLALSNSTVSGNSTGDAGGGLYNLNTLTLLNSTVTANTGAGTVDGIYNVGTVILTNTIVAANGTKNCDTGGAFTSGGYNLDDGNTCGLNATGDITNTAALLGPLADNGGDTQTHALLMGSPALDVIPPGSCPLPLDQRGIPRPQGGICDIGAFESSQSFSLTINGGNAQSTTIATAFSQPLQVTLVTSGTTIGQPGQVITFTAPSSGASLTQTLYTATTNHSGVASVTVTANTITGSYSVTATTQEVANPVLFNLTNTASSSDLKLYLPVVIKN